ncbi:hypothetical protein F5X97DRAFT_31265 [Nemania serpens]|nr:hypothetical protein F5X97DRAFT_31265 [Nemania serpens]
MAASLLKAILPMLVLPLLLLFFFPHEELILHIHSGFRSSQWQVLEGKLEERGTNFIFKISIAYSRARCSLLPLGTRRVSASIHAHNQSLRSRPACSAPSPVSYRVSLIRLLSAEARRTCCRR